MLAPLSWLKEYVDIDVSAKELETLLFSAGFEVPTSHHPVHPLVLRSCLGPGYMFWTPGSVCLLPLLSSWPQPKPLQLLFTFRSLCVVKAWDRIWLYPESQNLLL